MCVSMCAYTANVWVPNTELQAQEGVVIWSPEALATTVLKH